MSQTELTNDGTYHLGLQHLSNPEGTPVAVAVVKGTFSIEGTILRRAEEQVPVLPAGRPWFEPGQSSYVYEPECSYFKPATDVVLVGAAVAPSGSATKLHVGFSVGRLRKRATVFGDRFWLKGFGGPYLSAPEPFESMPLTYERAFGGWDCSDPDPKEHRVDGRNPVGTGFAKRFAPGQDRIPLPNIEDPADLINSMSSRPKVIGFGFTNFNWQPRSSLGGTFDSSWTEMRMPLLPLDFDPRFFNGASEGLISDSYLLGDEQVTLENCAPQPLLNFSLPGVPAPRCRFRVAGHSDQILTTVLDTIVINSLDMIVVLTWRCHVPLSRGPEFLKQVHLISED